CVCRNETALPTLLLTASVRRIAASIRMDTASPPASSAGLTILEPLDNRARLLLSMVALLFRLFAATVAAVFVLITSPMISVLDFDLRHPCRVEPVWRRSHTWRRIFPSLCF